MLEVIDNAENDFAMGELLLNSVRGLGPQTIQSLKKLALERDSALFTML